MTPTDFYNGARSIASKSIFPQVTIAKSVAGAIGSLFPKSSPQEPVTPARPPVAGPVYSGPVMNTQNPVASAKPVPSATAAPARPPVTVPSTQNAPMATLVSPNGQRVAVQSGSPQAQDYFGKGYTLPNAPVRPPATVAPVNTPTVSNDTTPPPYQNLTNPSTSGSISPSTQSDTSSQIKSLQDEYLRSLEVTPEEEAAQKRLNSIAEQQANLDQSARLGNESIRTQTIPMNFITGQQAALQRQLTNQQTGLTAQTVPLKDQITLLQAKRAAAGNVTSKKLEFEQKKIDAAQSQIKPVEVGGSLVQYDPVTKTYKTLFTAPNKPQSAVALGEGQKLVDPVTGKEIAMGNPKAPSETSTPSSYKEWQLAGSPGSYADWVKKTGNSGRPLSAAQAQLISDGNSLSSVLKPVEDLLTNQSTLFGPGTGRLGALNPYDTKSQSALASINTAAQVIGKYLEGGVLRKEDETKYQKMLPQLSDTPEVAKAKLDNVKSLVSQKQQQYLQDFNSAGFDTGGFSNGGSGDPLDSALGQLGFNSAATVQAQNGSNNDKVNKLAAAIAQHETGNRNIPGATGELATRYQFMPTTWKNLAAKYLGNANAPTSNQNQDKVAKAYISDLFKQGYNEQQIAMIWNGGTPNRKVGTTKTKDGRTIQYDTGKYANSVLSIYKNIG